MPDFYSEPGLNKWRDQVSTGTDHIDPFNGSLSRSYVDMYIPGNGGLDLSIQRHYTSNIWFSRENLWDIGTSPRKPTTLLPTGPSGAGWTMHFGRIIKAKRYDGTLDGICETNSTDLNDSTSNNAVLEMQNGSMEPLVVSAAGNGWNTRFVTRSFWLADCNTDSSGLVLYSPNGLKYHMDHLVTAFNQETYAAGEMWAWYPSKIEDGNGNSINFFYSGASGVDALIDKITTSDGREVVFSYTDGNLISITASQTTGETLPQQIVTYNYINATTSKKLLNSVTRPDGLKWLYEYNPADAPAARHALKTVTYPKGGTTSYVYGHVDFIGSVELVSADTPIKYLSVVVKEKTEADRDILLQTWTYDYQPATELTIEPMCGGTGETPCENDQTIVTFPGGKHIYKHYGIQRQLYFVGQYLNRELYKTGLLKEKEVYSVDKDGFSNLVQKEVYEWTSYGVLSSEYYYAPPYNYREVGYRQPSLVWKAIYKDGTTYATEYDHSETLTGGEVVYYLRPQRKEEISQVGTANEIRRITELDWYPLDLTAYPVFFYDRLVNDGILDSTGEFYDPQLSTFRQYDYTTGNLQWIQRNGLYESFSHYPTGDISESTDANQHTRTYSSYFRGIPRLEIAPINDNEGIIVRRVVNSTGTIANETNGRGNRTSYQYDTLNRLSFIDLPRIDSSDLNIIRDNTLLTQVVERGAYKQTTAYDGFDRPLCVTVEDTGNQLITSKVIRYDELGRKRFESYLFDGACPQWGQPLPSTITGTSYEYDVLGRMTKTSHTDGTFRQIRYLAGNIEEITNERNFTTTNTYRSFGDPDADDRVLMKSEAPEGIITTFVRNLIGLVESISQNDITRTFSYYDNTTFLKEEINPETGVTSYGRDAVGNMTARQVGNVTGNGGSKIALYSYDFINRLTNIDYEDINTWDETITYNKANNVETIQKGSSSWLYSYNQNEQLQSEKLTVAGQIFETQYDFNDLDFINAITYPSQKIVTYSPDAYGRPTQVAPYINSIDYYPGGQQKKLVYANGQQTDFTLNLRKWVERAKTLSNVMDMEYIYDGMGNTDRITDYIDSTNSRTLGYDGVDRLISASGSWGSGSVSYDATGNIKTKNVGEINLTYEYYLSSNLLKKITGSRDYQYSYDSYGNIINNGKEVFSYKEDENLYQVGELIPATYEYDGNKRRSWEQGSDGKNTYYFYSQNNSLLGEYSDYQSGVGRPYKEYVLLQGKLVARVDFDPVNLLPLAHPGYAQTVLSGNTVTLDGTASRDGDGIIASYAWTRVSGPSVVLITPDTAIASFVAPQVNASTEMVFKLTVTDDGGASHSANVTITVNFVDTDSDGLPDVWEEQYFGNNNLSELPGGDYDQDGISNLDEFLRGYDPTIAAPTAPINFTVSSASNANTLSWSNVTDATSYTLYWSNYPGVTPATGTAVTDVTSPYVHSGIPNNTNHYYILTASNVGGESAPTAEANAYYAQGGWDIPTKMHTGIVPEVYYRYSRAGYPKIAVSGNGGAIAVWQDNDSDIEQTSIWAKHFTPNHGWGEAQLLESNPGFAQYPQVAMNDKGQAVVAWSQNSQINVARYTSSTGWTQPKSLVLPADYTIGSNYEHKASIDDQGNILVVWRGYEIATGNSIQSLFVSYYTASTGWTVPSQLSQNGEGIGAGYDLAMNDAGQAAVIWSTGKSTNYKLSAIYSRRFDPVTGWAAVEKLNSNPDLWGASTTKIAIDVSGNIMVAWNQRARSEIWDAPYTVWVKQYRIDQGWQQDEPIRPDFALSLHSLSMNDKGDAVLTSRGTASQYVEVRNVDGLYAYYYNRYTGWTAGELLVDGPYGFVDGVINDNGSAIVLWREVALRSARYAAGNGWQASQTITPETQSVGSSTVLAIDAAGNATAVWPVPVTGITSTDFWFNRYTVFTVPPVSNAGADQAVLETSPVILDGSLSSDTDGSVVAYQWSQIEGPQVVLSNPAAVSTSFVAPEVKADTVLRFILKVTDDKGESALDEVIVTVSILDSDGDGLSDVWEQQYFGVDNLAETANGDADGDSINNLDEFLNDYDPTVAAPAAPTGLIFTPSVEGNSLAWTNNPQANSYKVYWSWKPGVTKANGTVIDNVLNPYIHNVFTNNRNDYYVRVTAVGNGGESVTSVELPISQQGWSHASVLDNTKSAASNQNISMNDNGYAVATWQQRANYGWPCNAFCYTVNIFASYYTPGIGWSIPALLEEHEGEAQEVDVSISNDNSAVVVWRHFEPKPDGGYTTKILASSYQPATGWGQAQQINSLPRTSQSIEYPRVAMDGQGNAMAVWLQKYDTSEFDIWISRFSKDTGWGSPNPVTTTGSIHAAYDLLDLVMGDNGNAMLTWVQQDSVEGDKYWSAYANNGEEFGTPIEINSGAGLNLARRPKLDIDANGNGIIAWAERVDSVNQKLLVREYRAGSGWESPVIVKDIGRVDFMRLAMNEYGDVLIAWSDTNQSSSWFVKRSNAMDWGIPENIPNNFFSTSSSRVDIDGLGNAIATRISQDGMQSIRYTEMDGWSNLTTISSAQRRITTQEYTSNIERDLNPAYHSLRVNARGDAIVAWNQYEEHVGATTPSVWVNHFFAPPSTGLRPLANAGPSQSVLSGDTVTLDGSASRDNDGVIVSFAWTQVSGPSVALTTPNAAVASFVAPDVNAETALVFKLTVTDDTGASHSANVTVTVNFVDTDNDGMSDDWEQQYFGVDNLSETANGDFDADGISNLDEFLQGYDPTLAAPATPANLAASASSHQNSITWDSVVDATSYNLYWSNTSGVTPDTGTRITGATSPYLHSDIPNNTDYFYILAASNAGGESDPTAEVGAYYAEGAWNEPTLLEGLPGDMRFPEIQLADNGHAVATWAQQNGDRLSIFASYYTPAKGWTAPVEIDANLTAFWMPRLAVAENGTAMIVWQHKDNVLNNLQAISYQVDTGWGTPTILSTDMYGTSFAMDANGNAIAVMSGNGGLYARHYSAASGWGEPQLLNSITTTNNPMASFAMQKDGKAMLVWVDGGQFGPVSAKHFDPATGWQATVLLDGSNTTDPQVAMDGSGKAVATWGHGNFTSSYYLPGTGWSAITLLPGQDYFAWSSDLSMNASGNAVLTVSGLNASPTPSYESAYVHFYSPGVGWSVESRVPQIIPSMYTHVYNARGHIDAQGNVSVYYDQFSYNEDYSVLLSNTLVTSSYRPATGWSAAENILTFDQDAGFNIDVSVNSHGDAALIYQLPNSDALHDIGVRNFTMGTFPPVADAGIDQVVDEGTSFTLNASTSTDPDGFISGYYWSQVSGPAVTITDPTAAIITLAAPAVVGNIDLQFALHVYDDKGGTARDLVTISVLDITPPETRLLAAPYSSKGYTYYDLTFIVNEPATTYFRVTGGGAIISGAQAITDWQVYTPGNTVTVKLDKKGIVKLEYYSIDTVGNQGFSQTRLLQ